MKGVCRCVWNSFKKSELDAQMHAKSGHTHMPSRALGGLRRKQDGQKKYGPKLPYLKSLSAKALKMYRCYLKIRRKQLTE